MELVKRYLNVSNLVFFFFLSYADHFCLKLFSLFSAEGLRGRGQLRGQERHCPANIFAHCFISITAKKNSGNNTT